MPSSMFMVLVFEIVIYTCCNIHHDNPRPQTDHRQVSASGGILAVATFQPRAHHYALRDQSCTTSMDFGIITTPSKTPIFISNITGLEKSAEIVKLTALLHFLKPICA